MVRANVLVVIQTSGRSGVHEGESGAGLLNIPVAVGAHVRRSPCANALVRGIPGRGVQRSVRGVVEDPEAAVGSADELPRATAVWRITSTEAPEPILSRIGIQVAARLRIVDPEHAAVQGLRRGSRRRLRCACRSARRGRRCGGHRAHLHDPHAGVVGSCAHGAVVIQGPVRYHIDELDLAVALRVHGPVAVPTDVRRCSCADSLRAGVAGSCVQCSLVSCVDDSECAGRDTGELPEAAFVACRGTAAEARAPIEFVGVQLPPRLCAHKAHGLAIELCNHIGRRLRHQGRLGRDGLVDDSLRRGLGWGNGHVRRAEAPLASVEIRLAQTAQAVAALAADPQVVQRRRDAEPSNGDQAADRLQRLLAGVGATVDGLALPESVLTCVRVRADGHDPWGATDRCGDHFVPRFDGQQGLHVPLINVFELVLLGGKCGVVIFEAADLIPDKASDLKPGVPAVVLLHQPVVTQDVAQVAAPTDVVGRCLVAVAVVAVSVEGQIGDLLRTTCSSLARLQKMVQPAHVVGHCGTNELGIPLRSSDVHIVRPLLCEGLRAAPQFVVVPRLSRVVRLVPTLHYGAHPVLVRRGELRDANAEGVPGLLDHRYEQDPRHVHIRAHPPVVVPQPLNANNVYRRLQVLRVILISVLSVHCDAAEPIEGRRAALRIAGSDVPELDQRCLLRHLASAAPAAACGRARGS
mmetsp:Transcript_19225/g.55831  ORF Transcript_19225/g.55831 Transcript_19225/m.55831 type:complete len:693 (-) Transcript_19225:175-2253(-)